MTVLALIVTLLVVGLVLYIVQSLPIEATTKRIIVAVVLVVLVIWIADALLGGVPVLSHRIGGS